MSVSVLIVDDDRMFVRRLASMVSSLGYDVATAFTPDEARAHFEHQPSAVVLIDLFFDGTMCGIELIEHLQKTAHADDSVFIVLTAFGSIQTALDAVKRGADNYLAKGAAGMVNIDQLSLAISEGLEHKRVERELRITSRIFEALHSLSVHFAHTTTDNLLNQICRHVAKILSADVVVIAAPDGAAGAVQVRCSTLPLEQVAAADQLLRCVHVHVIETNGTLVCTPDSAPAACMHCMREPRLAVLTAVPVRSETGATIGALIAGIRAPAHAQEYAQRLLEIFAQRIGAELVREKYLQERQKLYEHLSQSQKMDAVGSLAAGIAHEFNNILCVISNSAQTIAGLTAAPDVAVALQAVEQAVDRGADLVRKLTNAVRVEAGEMAVVNLHEVVRAVLAMCHGTFADGITVCTALDAATPRVLASARQLEHVLLNLCLNARDAMPSGGTVRIATSAVLLDDTASLVVAQQLAPGPYALLTVTDTGCGMDADTLAHIFDPFFTRKHAGEGTGLGLTMVYNTVTLLKGTVTVDSAPGAGAAFSIYLPAHLTPSPGLPPAQGAPAAQAPLRVLVVDDDPTLRDTLRMLLVQHGCTVETAHDGLDACERCERDAAFDLVLLDMMMPRMNGYQTFKRLREIAPHLRVLIISGYSQSHEVQEMLKTGAAGFVSKPFRTKNLLETMHAALRTP